MSPLRDFVNAPRPLIMPGNWSADVHLHVPRATYRFRRNKNTDTPLPPEEPAGKNPPDGAIIYYWLKTKPRGPITLEIADSAGKVVRRYSSAEPVDSIPRDIAIPTHWIRPQQILSTSAGSHRFIWDLHYPPPAGVNFGYPISAITGDTPKEPVGPAVPPGRYSIKLTVDGRNYIVPLVVKMDPRVKMTADQLRRQFELGLQMAQITWEAAPAIADVKRWRADFMQRADTGVREETMAVFASFSKQLSEFETWTPEMISLPANDLARLSGQAAVLLDLFEGADMPPTAQAIAAARDVSVRAAAAFTAWRRFKSAELPGINAKLKATGYRPFEIAR